MFVCPFLGKFKKLEKDNFAWIPALELLEAAELKLNENDFNISPFKTQSLDQLTLVNMSATAIANSCDCSWTSVLHIIKDIFLWIVEIVKEGKDEIIIDLWIGKLQFSSKTVQFFNYEDGEIEGVWKQR